MTRWIVSAAVYRDYIIVADTEEEAHLAWADNDTTKIDTFVEDSEVLLNIEVSPDDEDYQDAES